MKRFFFLHFWIDDVLLYNWEEQCRTQTPINLAQPEENGQLRSNIVAFLLNIDC